MRTVSILLAALLAGGVVTVLPTGAATTCDSAVAPEVICPPILGVFCVMYALAEKQPVVPCVKNAIPDLTQPAALLP